MPPDPFDQDDQRDWWEGPAEPGRRGLGCTVVAMVAAWLLVGAGVVQLVWGWPL